MGVVDETSPHTLSARPHPRARVAAQGTLFFLYLCFCVCICIFASIFAFVSAFWHLLLHLSIYLTQLAKYAACSTARPRPRARARVTAQGTRFLYLLFGIYLFKFGGCPRLPKVHDFSHFVVCIYSFKLSGCPRHTFSKVPLFV